MENLNIIVPCAGKSSRFPNTRPKFLLADFRGRTMLEGALDDLMFRGTIYVVVLKEHVDKYNFIEYYRSLNTVFGMNTVKFVVLEEPTSGPAETVYKALELYDIPLDEPLLIKDCDSYFSIPKLERGNFVYTEKLSNIKQTATSGQKSYVISNDQDIVSTIVEKEIVSDNFCVGGYQFNKVVDFMNAFGRMKEGSEIFVSHIIEDLIEEGTQFIRKDVSEYVDVGTLPDWLDYNDKPTIFCDIDGVVVKNQSRFKGDGEGNIKEDFIPLENNVKTLLGHMNNGCLLVFTTSRQYNLYDQTYRMLMDLGFYNCHLLMGMNRSKRVVINDYNTTNPYPSAIAISLKQDEDNLDSLFPIG